MWLTEGLRREWVRGFGLPSPFWMLVGLPIASLLLFVSIFGSGQVRELSIALCDMDNSATSRRLAFMIESSPSISIDMVTLSEEESREALLSSKVYASVLIPRGFERSLLRGEQAVVVGCVTGENLTANGLISSALKTITLTYGIGVGVMTQVAKSKGEKQAVVQFRPIDIVTRPLFNPQLNYRSYLLPAFLFMILTLFTLVNTIYSVGSELLNGTAVEWLELADFSFVKAFVVKLLPLFLCSFLLYQLFLGVAYVGNSDCSFVEFLAVELVGMILIVSYQSIAILFVTLTSNLRFALSLGGGYGVMAFSFSGVTFPHMAMWDTVSWLTYLFPYSWFMRLIDDITLRHYVDWQSVFAVVVMLIFIFSGVVAVAIRRKVYLNEMYWGRD